MASTYRLQGPEHSGSSGGYRQIYLTLSQSKDIATNKSTITWTLVSAGNRASYAVTVAATTIKINGTQVCYIGQTAYTSGVFPAVDGSTSGTITVDHDSSGDKSVSVYMSTNLYEHTPVAYSGTWTLDSIPREATITSAPNFSDTDNPTIYYSNPAGTAVSSLQACIYLTGDTDDVAYRDISKTGSSYTFNLTNSERNVLRYATTAFPSRTVYFCVRTIIGGTTLYNSAPRTFNVVENDNSKPSLSTSFSVDNGSLPSVFNNVCIKGKTKINGTISASGNYGASISSIKTLIDGKTYTGASVTSSYISSDGNFTIDATVWDSRGFTRSINTITKTSYPYSPPSIVPISGASEVQCYRSNSDGTPNNSSTTLWIKAKKTYSSVNNINSCTLRYRTRLSSSQSWSGWTTLSTSNDQYNALISGTFAIANSYVVEIGVVDTIGETSSITFDIPTEDVPFHLGEGGKAIGIGRYADTSDDFSVKFGWKTTFDDPIYMNGVGLKFDSNLSSLPNVPSGVSFARYIQFVGSSDNYYILIDSNRKLFVGTALNSASTITWTEK